MEAKAITVQEKSLVERVSGWPAALKDYFNELKMEMRRVTWPNRNQVQGTTTVVIVSVFAFAAYFSLVDMVVGRAVEKLFGVLTR
jgi:preprotein translocase subunit SecE